MARWALLHGGDVFFLVQKAGATRAIIRMMSLLYRNTLESCIDEWNAVAYAEPHLIQAMQDVIRSRKQEMVIW
jgi:hypothetical protein